MAKKIKKAAAKAKPKAKAKAKPAKAAAKPAMPGIAAGFLDAYNREHATTLKLLRAYPGDKLAVQPHPKSKTARDLAWLFVKEQEMCETALVKGFDWSAPPPPAAPAPESMDAIIAAFDAGHQRVATLVAGMEDTTLLRETVKFFVAPKTLGDIPKIQFLWFLLCDQIHHRGQFSVYLRLADAKVPSIYGPSADEPWH